MNINSSLVSEMKDKQYRDAYVASQIRIGLPMQTRALRKSRDWSQPELAEYAGMAQPRISEIEKPGERRLNIETLLRLASAFDVALQVRFVPFSEFIDFSEDIDLDNFALDTFEEEVAAAEERERLQAPPQRFISPASQGKPNGLFLVAKADDHNQRKQPTSDDGEELRNAASCGSTR